ncbi:MAG: TetR/AcrR family transcriptional regulator [Candidatus Eiseniibacteriota bacterium]
MPVHRLSSGLARPGRRELKKTMTRRELIAAGRRLFAARGLYDSRIEDLARAAGIGKGTLYLYFASREKLIEAVVSAGFGELLARVQREALGASTREQLLTRVTRAHLMFFEDNPDLLRVFHQVRGLLKFNRRGWQPLRQVLESYIAGLSLLLSRRARTRRAASAAPPGSAALLFGAISGVTSMRASLSGSVPALSRSQASVRALVAMVISYEKWANRREGASAA